MVERLREGARGRVRGREGKAEEGKGSKGEYDRGRVNER